SFPDLDLAFQTQLFGQHIAHKVVLNALKDHFREGAKPKKALALSFHGWPGSGKTYVSQLIVENLFKEGAKSKFVRFFMARTHFMVEKHADIYKIHLMDWIRGNVSLCARSIFIFDEVDKLPRGVLDAVKPFLDYHEHIDGIDYRYVSIKSLLLSLDYLIYFNHYCNIYND
ncbi:Torsin-1B, partial [Blattella germanica]